MFRLFISLLCSVFSFTAFGENIARNQDTTRTERTLRVDYDFSGNAKVQHIALSELCSLPGWAGRNVNMDSVPLHGNGDITLTDVATHKVIYRQSFSTLFQEWLSTEEATLTARSFENTFLLPMPKREAEVCINLYDNKGGVQTSFTHRVDPHDILIRRLDHAPIPPHR